MPATPINKLPLGLLSFFGIKNGGRYPEVMPPSLQPVLDLQNLYEVSSEITLAGTVAVAAGSAVFYSFTPLATAPTPWVVPESTVWHVREFGIYTDPLGAGDSCEAILAVLPYLGANGTLCLGSAIRGVQVSPHSYAIGLLRDAWLQPGDNLGFQLVQGVGVYGVHGHARVVAYQF